MPPRPRPTRPLRAPLDRDRIVAAAIGVADAGGLSALTMRALASALQVTPMSLYHHMADKEALLDAVVDHIMGRIDLPAADGDWRTAMAARAHSARRVLGAHPWAIALLDSRAAPGPATLHHHDAVLGALFAGGFSPALAGHAMALLDAYVYGFALQEAALPFADGVDAATLAGDLVEALPADEFPHLARFARERVMAPGYDFAAEFPVGLQLILDGLAGALADQR